MNTIGNLGNFDCYETSFRDVGHLGELGLWIGIVRISGTKSGKAFKSSLQQLFVLFGALATEP